MADKKRMSRANPAPNSMMLRRTLTLLIVCGIVAFLVLAIRLFQLQVVQHDFYESEAISNQVRHTTVSARRGTIYDTTGKILAMSASVDNVFISPKEIKLYEEDIDLIAEKLHEILGVDKEKILQLAEKTSSYYQTVAKKVEPEVSEQIREFKKEYKINGVKLEEDSKRYYPYSSLAAHVIGFVNIDNDGAYGLEAIYNDELTGVNGRVVRVKNAVGTDILFTSYEDYYDATDGNDVYTTIDASIQHYLEKHLTQAVSDYNAINGGGAIAMDVNTGAILGMVSLGNFDLNNYQDVSDEVKALIEGTDDEAEKKQILSDAQLLQWRNKTLNDTYEPGSTFKILTLSMALNEGLVNEQSTFYCSSAGVKTSGDSKPRYCWKAGGHGSQTLTQCLQHSCNVAFINMGLMVGAEKFYEYAEAFGLFNAAADKTAGQSGKTGIDLGGESGSIWWSYDMFTDPLNKSQLAAASFGQTFNITPIQLITAVSACVNGGNLMKPYTVEEVVSPEGISIKKTEPTVVRQVISAETSAKVCTMLEAVVGDKTQGTGKNAYVAGYRIGGKTGTSKYTVKEASGVDQYIVSFIGVAPMDDPQIAILVFLDSPTNSGVYVSGGQMAAPTVGKIFADVLPYIGIEPQYSETEQKTIDRSVPDLKGLTLAEANAKLTEAGFISRVVGSGDTVTSQLPAANAIIAADSQVIIYCGDATPQETGASVPNLYGYSYSVARQYLGGRGLFIRATGPITDPTKVVVTSQSVVEGATAAYGSVIEVSLIDQSDLGTY